MEKKTHKVTLISSGKWITTDELIERLKENDVDFKKSTLRSWYRNGFPQPKKTSKGRGKGMVGMYPEIFISVIILIVKNKNKGESIKEKIENAFTEKKKTFLHMGASYTADEVIFYFLIELLKQKESLSTKISTLIKDGTEDNFSEINAILEEIRSIEKLDFYGKEIPWIPELGKANLDEVLYFQRTFGGSEYTFLDLLCDFPDDEFKNIASQIKNILKEQGDFSLKVERLIPCIHEADKILNSGKNLRVIYRVPKVTMN